MSCEKNILENAFRILGFAFATRVIGLPTVDTRKLREMGILPILQKWNKF